MHTCHIYEVRLLNLHGTFCKYSFYNSGDNTGLYTFFWHAVWNHDDIKKVQQDKCDESGGTSLYLQSSINVLNACHFTYSLIKYEDHEHHLKKSLIILYRGNTLQLNFLELLCYHLLSSYKSLSSN